MCMRYVLCRYITYSMCVHIHVYIIVHVCELHAILCVHAAYIHAQSVGVHVQCICGHVFSVCGHTIQSTCRMSCTCTCYVYLCIIERMKFQN